MDTTAATAAVAFFADGVGKGSRDCPVLTFLEVPVMIDLKEQRVASAQWTQPPRLPLLLSLPTALARVPVTVLC